ncbi:hypothetical protein [Candidatus Methylomicrobium oryzae]|uniref:hypothetical protein n=1 Tax=Candidatus Methylomicrobium oryzae TaxID=2802053 RepID=UPI0019245C7D|nr:hypothetical protein [Methylomicrobium sp. RS1]
MPASCPQLGRRAPFAGEERKARSIFVRDARPRAVMPHPAQAVSKWLDYCLLQYDRYYQYNDIRNGIPLNDDKPG